MEKRFLLFAGSNYYPEGGWSDFVKSFDTYEKADNYLLRKETGKHYGVTYYEYTDPDTTYYTIRYDWYHIHDLGEGD